MNIHPKYSGNLDSISLLIEWSIGCEIFARIWGADEKPILISSCVGGVDDCCCILNAFYPPICRRNKSKDRVYQYRTDSYKILDKNSHLCQMGCFFKELQTSSSTTSKYSLLEITLIGQQLLAQILAPYLVKYLKSSTLPKGNSSSNISNSSRFSNTSSTIQGFISQDHIWKYSNAKISKGSSSHDDKDQKRGILDFQGTISFLIFHWDDIFCELFDKQLSRLTTLNSTPPNPDALLCIIQRVGLLWENKDFDILNDPLLVVEFIDAAIVLSRIAERDERSHAFKCLIELRRAIPRV